MRCCCWVLFAVGEEREAGEWERAWEWSEYATEDWDGLCTCSAVGVRPEEEGEDLLADPGRGGGTGEGVRASRTGVIAGVGRPEERVVASDAAGEGARGCACAGWEAAGVGGHTCSASWSSGTGRPQEVHLTAGRRADTRKLSAAGEGASVLVIVVRCWMSGSRWAGGCWTATAAIHGRAACEGGDVHACVLRGLLEGGADEEEGREGEEERGAKGSREDG
ncbi:hypothetical protein CALCODRAFT_295221 [Calocera cornea HHB12733]|uniref:Uncharacterized protein n=1 Tax=Calocera cornea HHB12733 TaxID=1353952 RepID=A0A165FP18_9BASI|nr:hypothetical protein CALCODRAFT_295221 [Calocera cornea HHB12733]